MSRTSRFSKGFTLVELLVVIGIIALLISILLPVLKKAQIAGAAANCAANLKQIGTAVMMYANDNKGWAPKAGGRSIHSWDDAIWWQSNWQGRGPLALDKSALAPYLGVSKDIPVGPAVRANTPSVPGMELGYYALGAGVAGTQGLSPGSQKMQKVFRCPGDIGVEERPQWDPSFENVCGGYHYSYSMSYWFEFRTTQNLLTDIPDANGKPGDPRYKFTQIRRPADIILFGEEERANDCTWWLHNAALTADDPITRRHGGMGNILFCDTHVDRLPPKWFTSAANRRLFGNPFLTDRQR
jgi:prepilin-type N-terminal cleavage/methylation domain-containing protein/prepilin-type processing-associated H-X9-DG protein